MRLNTRLAKDAAKRVIDGFRAFCRECDVTLCGGLELLLSDKRGGSG